MATLLLTALGSAIGGPIGGIVGAMAGQRVDQALFAPKGPQGARLADLSVQSSSYGASIPRLYGRMRVSGTVIWATDLREERRKVSQGKGRPKATVYSYSASFAVLLSARPAGRIGRIWADGKLLRGAAGDFKVETGFRFHGGGGDQPVDPLIASVEGAAAPAYRGRAYAVFEDMALDGFGNRIPMLSFEILADEGDPSTSDLIADLLENAVGGDPATLDLKGYVGDGTSIRAALAPLGSIEAFGVRDNGSTIEIGGLSGTPLDVHVRDAGASARDESRPVLERTRSPSMSLPALAEIGFSDVSRDYQSGLQGVNLHRAGTVLRIDLPAALEAESARRLISARLFQARLEGQGAELRLPWRCFAAWQADTVRFDGMLWRILRLRLEAMCLVLQLVAADQKELVGLPADPGRAINEPDRPAGETVLLFADLPPMDDTAPTGPLVIAAAAGRSAGWRSATLLFRPEGQADWQDIGPTAAPAVMGECADALGVGSPFLFDLTNSATVRLLHDGMSLLNADDVALIGGANTALVGDEIVQFGRAERIASGRWRLSRLLRGRRGTEDAIATHRPGERFLLLEPDSLLKLPVPPGSPAVELLAKGVGDSEDVHARCEITGNALRPLPPVRLRSEKLEGGGIRVSWVRRSREGWRWLDRVEVPLGEETELYRVDVLSGTVSAEFIVTVPQLTLPQSLIDDLHLQGLAHVDLVIAQIGRFAVSRPLTARISV